MDTASFEASPYLVIWETTRACALRCVHCRAEAVDKRSEGELDTDEAFALLQEVRRFGKPLMVLTGGDPLRRPDIFDIVEYGSVLGLRMAMTPSATPEASRESLERLQKKGLQRLAVSLDASTSERHDDFRRVAGSYEWTLKIMRWANELGLSLQINTTVTRHNLADLDATARLLEKFRVDLWSVFFLVPMGRASLSQAPGAADLETVFERLAEISRTSSYLIKSTEAPQYRRVLLQKSRGGDAPRRPILPIGDGKGFAFVSHTGEIYPSGFLPVSAGNVRTHSLVDLYRNSELFKKLRDPSRLTGKCGACEFKAVCGGSRARAYAVHGDVMASDPFCVHVPKGYQPGQEEMAWW